MGKAPCAKCKKAPKSKGMAYCLPCKSILKRMRKYKISEKEVADLVAKPCEICDKQLAPGKMAIDHCHASGLVRGMLCQKCNVGLGYFNDSVDLLLSAIQYLLEKTA